MKPFPDLPESLPAQAWTTLDEMARAEYDMLLPSYFTQPTLLLDELAAELGVTRRNDPLSLLRALNTAIYNSFAYKPQTTEVDSPIDVALEARQGVCQDFAHIMTALVRSKLGIPCCYVSGYLFQRQNGQSDRSAQDATHAWVEVLLPDLGWVASTRPIICCAASGISAWRSGAIMPTCRPHAGCSKARPRAS